MLNVELDRPVRLKARWVFPVSAAPIEHGVIEVQNGQVTALHGQSDTAAIDLGNVALIPGLVNAHTHLEFSDLTQPVLPAEPFTAWIRSLVATRRERPATEAVIQAGLRESVDSGTALIGEIATQDWPESAYGYQPIRSVVFREILGLRREVLDERLEIARHWLSIPGPSDSKVIRGISPHAPYSVHPDLYRRLVDLAVQKQAPLAIHLAETRAELELLDRGTGEFVTMLQQFGAWDETAIPRASRPLDYLRPLADVPRALVIHGNYLAEDELNWLRDHRNVSVVYCPRTHAFFGHSPHPWLKMLDMGIAVALGTDSRGSNPDLSIWKELRCLRSQFPNVDPARLLELGTLAGAKALGCDEQGGSLEVGKRADFAVVDLNSSTGSDPYQMLFSGNVNRTLVR